MSELETPPSPDMLVKLLERQQALVEQLGGLSERQASLIEAGESDALVSLLAQRQKIMDQFIASQDSLTTLSDACRRDGAVADGTRKRIGALIADISERLSEIMSRDEQDRQQLESNRHQVGESLAGVTTAKAAQHAYVRSRAVNNRFADQQG